MPTYRSLVVHVTSKDGEAFAEYGVSTLDRQNLARCYIESKNGTPFCISMKLASLPFPELDNERSEHTIATSTGGMSETHLLATLRLDGREQWEKRSIMYLDIDKQSDHPSLDNEVVMRHRIIKDANGDLRECGWYFKEVGIDTVMEQLDLKSAGQEAVPTNADYLSGALSQLGADGMGDAEEKAQAGQVVLTFEKIKVGKKSDRVLRTHVSDGSAVPKDAAKVTHTSALDEGSKASKYRDTVNIKALEPDEQPFATFKFFYRSEEKLRTMGLIGSRTTVGGSTIRGRGLGLLQLTAPLPLQPPPFEASQQPTFTASLAVRPAKRTAEDDDAEKSAKARKGADGEVQ